MQGDNEYSPPLWEGLGCGTVKSIHTNNFEVITKFKTEETRPSRLHKNLQKAT